MAESALIAKGPRIAVLIDGENARPSLLGPAMEEVALYGTPTVRRIFGDWTSGQLNGWTDGLHDFAFQAAQQHSFTKGKNSTDGRLIIEAMDILHGGTVEAFCIMSSDSDYAGLAKRLRESGKFVLGIGERKTPAPFVRACDKFTYTDLLRQGKGDRKKDPVVTTPAPKPDPALKQKLLRAVEDTEDESGWANLSQTRENLQKNDPGFDPRDYGRSRFSLLFKFFPDAFEFRDDTCTHVQRKR